MFGTLGGFRFMQAESEDLKKAIYRLRYQVYVEEFGFERQEDHPGGLEMDEYEPHSLYLIALTMDGAVVGTCRLVLHSDKGFPIEHVGPLHFIGEKPPAQHIAEISRLAISPTYRRRTEDGQYGVETYLRQSEGGVLPDSGPIPEQYDKRQRPMIVLGLHYAMYQVSKHLGLTHWYMIAEQKLWATLRKFNLLFHQIGEPVDYHGIRIPYLGIIAEIEECLYRADPAMYHIFTAGLEEQYRPKLRV
jgi:N-acyl amino acid synthase of PEP-CTERM/exosortase system